MEFEWDPKKNVVNYTKHKVSFEIAKDVFCDPLARYTLDSYVGSEERWIAIGMALGRYLLVVVHTYRDRNGVKHIRLISARKATPHERKEYEGR